LVFTKWDGIVDYDIKIETHDDTGKEYVMVDITFDIEQYWKNYDKGEYDYHTEMDDDISQDVTDALKYLGIYKSITEIYVIEE
jgi:hypothetical protein